MVTILNIQKYTALKNKGKITWAKVTPPPIDSVPQAPYAAVTVTSKRIDEDGDAVAVTQTEEVKRAEIVALKQKLANQRDECTAIIADIDATLAGV